MEGFGHAAAGKLEILGAQTSVFGDAKKAREEFFFRVATTALNGKPGTGKQRSRPRRLDRSIRVPSVAQCASDERCDGKNRDYQQECGNEHQVNSDVALARAAGLIPDLV